MNVTMLCLTVPSFHEGSGSDCADGAAGTTSTYSRAATIVTRRSFKAFLAWRAPSGGTWARGNATHARRLQQLDFGRNAPARDVRLSSAPARSHIGLANGNHGRPLVIAAVLEQPAQA